MKHPKKTPYHPVIIGIYPVLVLYLVNIQQTLFYTISQAFITSLVILLVSYLAFLSIYRDTQKGSLATSIFLIFVFGYGHIYSFIDAVSVGNIMIGRHRWFMPIWIGSFLLLGYFLLNSKHVKKVNRGLNNFSIILLFLVVAQIGLYQIQPLDQSSPKPDSKNSYTEIELQENLPDVYYIVLDAYSREDVLLQSYGLDNTQLLDQLRRLGFIVADCSQSNYVHTFLSLSSSLNLNYLDSFDLPTSHTIGSYLQEYETIIKQSTVRKHFESIGYKTITFKSIYPFLDITDSTYYYDYFAQSDKFSSVETLNFQALFIKTTILRPLQEYLELNSNFTKNLPLIVSEVVPTNNIFKDRNYMQYQQNLYLLDVMETLPELPGPKFVYAHLFVTHQPFTFNSDGSFRWPVIENDESYVNQVLYLNSRLPAILESIIQKSDAPPIIIIQSDHSYPWSEERLKILNAYYLPGGNSNLIYPQISPVNSFRIILNTYFDGNYPLLPDNSYYSPREDEFNFKPIKNTCTINK